MIPYRELNESEEAMTEKQGRPPVVFHFQPKSYQILESPEELKEWERLMREEVGLSADIANLSGTATESCSLGKTDDSDQD